MRSSTVALRPPGRGLAVSDLGALSPGRTLNISHFSILISHFSICLTLESCLFQLLVVHLRTPPPPLLLRVSSLLLSPLQLTQLRRRRRRGGGGAVLIQMTSLHLSCSAPAGAPPHLPVMMTSLHLRCGAPAGPPALALVRCLPATTSMVSRFIFYYAISHSGSCKNGKWDRFPICKNGNRDSFLISHYIFLISPYA